jgi:hypothetical protein
MICLTSISPAHTNGDQQKLAVDSWVTLGMKVISFNSKKELSALRPVYENVEFVETERTTEHIYGKPYVMINAVLDWAKTSKENNFCIINSDIELKTDKETIQRIEERMQEGILLSNRVNYDNEYVGAQYLSGIDTFFINKKFIPFFNQSMYCFGQCFWDYWIPYKALKTGIEVSFIKQNISFHKNHAAQYSSDMWKKAGRYFLWENNLYQFNDTTGIGQMSRFIYNYIYNASKRIEI